MQIRARTVVLGFLIASSALAVRAEPKDSKATPPINPAATQPSAPIDLALRPAAAQISAPIALATTPAGTAQPGTADLAWQSASADVKEVVRWVVDSRDNAGLPFLLIDKVNAQVLVFSAAGQVRGATPALLGMARGDRMLAPNSATMEQMPPPVRITPAGRFVSRLGIDSQGKELLILDYDASLSLHAVVKGTPKERRAERLKSTTAEDNRISYGCINVPGEFYKTIVSPAFTRTKGIVYVLPETRSPGELFGFQPANAAAPGGQRSASAVEAPATGKSVGPVAK